MHLSGKFLRAAIMASALSALCVVSASAASLGIGTVSADALRLRKEANTSSAILATAAKGDNVELIYQTVGEGTAYLTEVETGAVCSLTSPLGHGWQPSEGKSLIVGGGVGAAPLFMFTEQLVREGREVEVVLGAQTASMMVTRDDYASLLGRDPIVATDDGSLGYAGFCTEPVREELARGDYSAVYCCGPTPLMRAVAAIAEEAGVPCWVSMEKRMACGVGACLSCVVETQAGKRRSCVDGPVFNAKELVW